GANRVLRFQTGNALSKTGKKPIQKPKQKIHICKCCVTFNSSSWSPTTPPLSPSTATSTTVLSSSMISPASSLSCCSSNSFYLFTDSCSSSPTDNNSLYPIWNFVMFPEVALKPEELSTNYFI
ncbi:unnamed protein product, partial [Didymodactylos carnosus]